MRFILVTKEFFADKTPQDFLKWSTRAAIALVFFAMIWANLITYQRLEALKHSYESQSEQLTASLQRAHDESVTNAELDALIDKLITDNDVLRKNIKALKARPSSIGTIEVQQPGTVETVIGTFPLEYIYKLASDMPVAQHTYNVDENLFTATTYDLGVKLVIVTVEDKEGRKFTYVDSNFTTSADDTQYPVEAVAEFRHSKPKSTFKMLDPHVNLGVALAVPPFQPRASFGMSLSSIGPTSLDNSVRFLNLNLQAGKSFAVGLDPVGLNLTKLVDVPILQDTWLWAGPAAELAPSFGTWSGTVTVSSTL